MSWNESIVSSLNINSVDLFVRSWVEISYAYDNTIYSNVDLFVRSWVEISRPRGRQSRNQVDLFVRSWVEILRNHHKTAICPRRPLREVVSWNKNNAIYWDTDSMSTSSWGRELKYTSSCSCTIPATVDLFVRSWVEILTTLSRRGSLCVDLFVRSWVEILR